MWPLVRASWILRWAVRGDGDDIVVGEMKLASELSHERFLVAQREHKVIDVTGDSEEINELSGLVVP